MDERLSLHNQDTEPCLPTHAHRGLLDIPDLQMLKNKSPLDLIKKHGNFTIQTGLCAENPQTTQRLIKVKQDVRDPPKTPACKILHPTRTSIVPYLVDESSNDSLTCNDSVVNATNTENTNQNMSRPENTLKNITSHSRVILDKLSEGEQCDSLYSFVVDPIPNVTTTEPSPLTAASTGDGHHTLSHTKQTDTIFHNTLSHTKQSDKYKFPLIPDFTDFARNSDIEIDDYNLTKEDLDRTKMALSNSVKRQPPTPILEKTFPQDFLSKMWPQARPPIKPTEQKNTLTSDSQIIIIPETPPNFSTPVKDITNTPSSSMSLTNTRSTISLDSTISSTDEYNSNSDSTASDHAAAYTQNKQLRRNLFTLKRTKLNRDRLQEIGEGVSNDFKRKCCIGEEPLKKKPKIKKIEWTQEDENADTTDSNIDDLRHIDNLDSNKDDLRHVLTDKIKRIRLMTDNTNLPSKHAKQDTPKTNTQITDTQHSDRQIITAKRYIRKCRLCNQENKNLKTHLATAHLKCWWGVLGDQTCWVCQQYHGAIQIFQCGGTFVPLFHREAFIDRHVDFIAYLCEDFGVPSPKHVLQKVIELKLQVRSVSGFSEKEQFFLEEIDRWYNQTSQLSYSSQNPTRVSELFHWKTLTEILLYLRTHGNISGRGHNIGGVTIIDTNCDINAIYRSYFYTGCLAFFPPLARENPPHALGCVITSFTDPRTDIPQIRQTMNDTDIRVSFGVDMGMTGYPNREYYNFVANNIKNHRVAAVGGLGLNGRPGSALLKSQIVTLENFLLLAKPTLKPVRIFNTNMCEMTYNIIRSTVGQNHPIHLLDYTGGPVAASRFLSMFPNGFIGLSCSICDPSPALLQTIKEIPLDRIVLESNSPHQCISYKTLSKPTDILVLADTIARIKDLNTRLIIKRIRENTANLYKC